MKKIAQYLLSAAVATAVGFSSSPAHAQLTSGNAVVAVTVVDVLALAVVVPAVPLSMGAVTAFQNGTSYTAPAHLLASSNHAFDIKVKSDGDLKGTTTPANSIPISNIMVQAAPTTTTSYGTQLNLSISDQPIVSNSPAGMAKAFDVKYSIAGNNSAFYVNGDIYHATLTYTIVAR